MQTDVLIVGAGPAGSTLALRLARSGFDVIIVERKRFPRRKVCGEYLNCGSVGLLSELDLLQRLHHRMHIVRGVDLSAAGRVLALDFPQAAGSMARAHLDALLLEAAREAGVVMMQAGVTDLIFEDDRVAGAIVASPDGPLQIKARFTVGADGAGSIVARKLKVTQSPSKKAHFAMGGHFTDAASSDRLTMYVKNGSYLAVNPISDVLSNVMLITPQSRIAECAGEPDAWFARSARAMKAPYTDVLHENEFDAQKREGDRVSVGPLFHRVDAAYAGGALLIGDAAGFISPFTGQGVYMALLSAKAAATAIAAAAQQPSRESTLFAAYDTTQRKERSARSLLSRCLTTLGFMPPLARSVMQRVGNNSGIRSQLLEIFCGIAPPSVARGAMLLVPFVR